MARIGLQGMKFYAFHGYYDFERRIGNEFIVDVMVELPMPLSPEEKISNTYNYEMIYDLVKKFMAKRYLLLETLAHDIAKDVKDSHAEITAVHIKIEKLNPPLGGKTDAAVVELSFL
ncbi:MAG: dihydroneopterin aldolase [Saprospiraceae bacterium]